MLLCLTSVESVGANLCARIGDEIGVDPKVILQTSHGRRSIDMLKILAPEKANWECE
jgi:glycerol 3-phosphatase-1